MVKTKSLKIRFEEADYEKLEHHARARGVSMSIIIRELVSAMPSKPMALPIAKIIYQIEPATNNTYDDKEQL